MKENQNTSERNESRPRDRLTPVLIVVALLLIAAAAALALGLLRSDRAGTDLGDLGTDPVQAIVIPTVPTLAVVPTPVPITPPACSPPPDWQIHVVSEGDTLSGLAVSYESDIDTLMYVNCLEDHLIKLNQELFVPDPSRALVSAAPVSGQPVPPGSARTSSADQYLNIVLLGSDKRPDDNAWRTDTIIVVSLDLERGLVRLLSVPRDLWVDIPGHGPDRINTADLWGELARVNGGPDLVKQTIHKNLGIPVHYWVRADFDGFMKIIDAVGGLDIDVECPLPDIELEAGVQHMDGKLALWYARSRMSTNDFDRSRRQRKILMALWDQALSPSIIPKIPSLFTATADTIQTNLPLDQVIAMAFMGLKLRPNQIYSQSIGPWQTEDWTSPGGAAVLLPLHDEIKELLDGFYGPIDTDFLERISRTKVSVRVVNGSLGSGFDELAATKLRWAGFKVTGSGPADSQVATSQVIVHNADQAVAELAAVTLDLMPSSLAYQPDPASDVDIVVILGQDYDPCQSR